MSSNPIYTKEKISTTATRSGGRRLSGVTNKHSDNTPRITIITATFNSEKRLVNTIESIVSQTYKNLEYIVIDGGSTDGTLKILEEYSDRIDYWISEPDVGISDAFNKGIKFATGKFINFQGDGDGFVTENSLHELFRSLDDEEYKLVSGRIRRITENGDEIFISKKIENFSKMSLLFKMSLPHQGLFTDVSLFKKYGLFDLKNRYCMDYEHLLRMYHNFPKTATSEIIVANRRADGLGNGKEYQIYKEYHDIKKKNKVAPYFFLQLLHYSILLSRLVGLRKKVLIKD